MNIPVKWFLVLAGFVFILAVGLFLAKQKINKLSEEKEAAENAGKQNALGLEQQLTQTRDSVQILALQIKSLNKDNKSLQKENTKYVATTESLKIYISNISVQGSGIAITGHDSNGDFTEVQFEGKKLFVSFRGNTRKYANFSNYRLDIYPDVIDISSELYRDVDNVWKIKTSSKTPGVTLKTFDVVDSSLFAKQFIPPIAESSSSTIGLTLEAALMSSLQGKLEFAPAGEVFYKYYFVKYQPLQKTISGGVRYTLTIW